MLYYNFSQSSSSSSLVTNRLHSNMTCFFPLYLPIYTPIKKKAIKRILNDFFCIRLDMFFHFLVSRLKRAWLN